MSKTLTKVERKEIVKLLQSLGLRTSRKNSTIEEVKFARFERVSHVKQDGYKWDSEEGKCVKKKKSSTYILGRGYGYGHHHHHDDDDKEDNTDNGSDGADAGGDAGGGGGMGAMFDFLGDMLMQEMNYKDAQEKGMTVSSNPPPIDHAELNRKRVKKAVLPQTSDKDRAK